MTSRKADAPFKPLDTAAGRTRRSGGARGGLFEQSRLEPGAIMLEPRHREARIASLIVPPAEPDRIEEVRNLLDGIGLLVGQRPALSGKAELRLRGQARLIVAVARTQIPLRRDMKADRLGDGRTEMTGKERGTGVVVPLAGPLEEMPDVVEESRQDQAVGRVILFGQERGLEGVFLGGNPLPKACSLTLRFENPDDVVHRTHHTPPERWIRL